MIHMAYTIRPAIQTDQAAINALIRQVGINPLGIKWQRFLVAIHEVDGLIGCGQIKPHRDGSFELASIAVQKAWRKQGVARAIISELQRVHGHPLWLMCRSELRIFYETCGYVEINDPKKMPPYFRRIKRFANFFGKLARRDFPLSVMVNEPAPDR